MNISARLQTPGMPRQAPSGAPRETPPPVDRIDTATLQAGGSIALGFAIIGGVLWATAPPAPPPAPPVATEQPAPAPAPVVTGSVNVTG